MPGAGNKISAVSVFIVYVEREINKAGANLIVRNVTEFCVYLTLQNIIFLL
jgi:hypothetical protein